MHRVVAVAIPDVILFDLAIPAEVFGRTVERHRYAFEVCAERPGAVSSTSGIDVGVSRGLGALNAADTVIVPGFYPRDPSPAVIRALKHVREYDTVLAEHFEASLKLGWDPIYAPPSAVPWVTEQPP